MSADDTIDEMSLPMRSKFATSKTVGIVSAPFSGGQVRFTRDPSRNLPNSDGTISSDI
jgi:hypothetical protein